MPKDNAPTTDHLIQMKLNKASQSKPSVALAQNAMQSLDLTSLSGVETKDDIVELCNKAKSGNIAAVCVYQKFVAWAAEELKDTSIAIATVINFPLGSQTNDGDIATAENTRTAVENAIKNGATEIDIVADYMTCKDDMDESNARMLLMSCRNACGDNAKMKVILETAAFEFDYDIVACASMAIESGADFIKTSTGKFKDPEFPDVGGATLDAVLAMMNVIKKYNHERKVGLKISGGVSDKNFASFLSLVKDEMGAEFLNSQTFRFGASGIYDYLKHAIETNGESMECKQKHGSFGY